jgi:hypothetical protein
MNRPSDASWVIPAACVGLFALVVGCELIPTAAAQTVAYNEALISWENATETTDGSPIPATGSDALATTRIIRSLCNADGSAGANLQTLTVPVPGGPLSVLFGPLPDNTVQCFRARHVTAAGTFSDFSATVSKAIIPPPAPPKKSKPPRNPRAT